DRTALLSALRDRYPHAHLSAAEQQKASQAPVCKRVDLFGEDRFVSCLTGACGDVSGDARTDCITDQCGPALAALKSARPECATALMAQVGKSSLSGLWNVIRPWRPTGLYAYDGSDGLILVSKRPLSNARQIDFSDISTLNRRRALAAEVDVAGTPVTIACTHLSADLTGIAPYPGSFSSWADENRAQVERLIEDLGPSGPTLAMGDFNCGLDDASHGLKGELEESCLAMESAGYADPAREVWPACTWCADNLLNADGGEHHNALIDHVYVRGLTPVEGGPRYTREVTIDTKSDGLKKTHLSDHAGYGVTLRLGDPPAAPTASEATAFAHRADAELRYLWRESSRRAWAYETDLTDAHEASLVEAESATMAWMTENIPRAAGYLRAEGLDESMARQLKILTGATALPAPSDPEKREALATVAAKLNGMYGKGKHCTDPADPETCRDLGDLETVLRESDDWDEQLEAWQAWRTVSPPMKHHYERFVALGNEGAVGLGYADMGELWRGGYDMTPAELETETERLWQQVKPMYDELHCYARARLVDAYGRDRVDPRGLIPAHVTGNMWAQSWEGLYPMLEPHPGAVSLDVTRAMEEGGWDPMRIAHTGEDFFTSMGLDPMPETFWERSMFAQPEDREVVCHASAWDVELADDQRVKMCIRPTLDDLVTMHHELGHNYYNHYHTDLPILLQGGAHDGFHEAIGDAIALSITPGYLHQLGLVDAVEETPEALLNKQMLDALQKVAFLPFGRMIDQWRWDVFSGAVAPADWNDHWWTLRAQYQGIGAPVARADDDFDPGAKFHIPGNTPYLRYFLAAILQFQMHEAMCAAAGHEGPLHTCSVYDSRAAGEKMEAVLSLGASKPWPDALAAITGTREMDAGPMLAYFAPLRAYLQEQNRRQACGWSAGE
ncbi:MAG: M2 family metallopeptidase, partial [Myxococcota bacterium]|nr:M2 family metallopeptidase [Myxococcota bacterium]